MAAYRMTPMFLAWNTGAEQQGGRTVMLLTEMEDVRGCIWLGYFLRSVAHHRNNHIKMLVRKVMLIGISQR